MGRWTQDDIEILKEYYPSHGSKYCSELLSKSRDSINKRARLLEIHTSIHRKWSQEEDKILKQYYIKYGVKYCADLLNKSHGAISGRVRTIGLTRTMTRWNEQEIDIFRQYYPDYGSKYCADLLGKSRWSIIGKAFRLGIISKKGIKTIWSKADDDILKKYYPEKGSKYCANLLNRSYVATKSRANSLGLKTNIATRGLPQKQILKKLTNNKVIALCKVHGKTPHYLRNGKIADCIKCQLISKAKKAKTHGYKVRRLEIQKKYRSTLVGKFAYRLRSSFRSAFRSKNITKTRIGCFRFLPYSPQQLCDYLEAIRQRQGNQCPMCCRSYDIASWTIDHILPINIAQTKEDVLKLFALDNLSLLCGSCNTSKGARILTPDQIKRMRANGY